MWMNGQCIEATPHCSVDLVVLVKHVVPHLFQPAGWLAPGGCWQLMSIHFQNGHSRELASWLDGGQQLLLWKWHSGHKNKCAPLAALLWTTAVLSLVILVVRCKLSFIRLPWWAVVVFLVCQTATLVTPEVSSMDFLVIPELIMSNYKIALAFFPLPLLPPEVTVKPFTWHCCINFPETQVFFASLMGLLHKQDVKLSISLPYHVHFRISMHHKFCSPRSVKQSSESPCFIPWHNWCWIFYHLWMWC